MALATSVDSARVGRGFLIMESSIWVAVITCLPADIGLLDQLLLENGTSSSGISTPMSPRATMMPSDHTDDLVDVVHALHVLNFGNDVDGVAVVLLQISPDLQDILGAAGKGGGDEIKAVFNAENDISPVLLG